MYRVFTMTHILSPKGRAPRVPRCLLPAGINRRPYTRQSHNPDHVHDEGVSGIVQSLSRKVLRRILTEGTPT